MYCYISFVNIFYFDRDDVQCCQKTKEVFLIANLNGFENYSKSRISSEQIFLSKTKKYYSI